MKTKSENGMGLSTQPTGGGPGKRAYRAPSLTVYGDLRALTLVGKIGAGGDVTLSKTG